MTTTTTQDIIDDVRQAAADLLAAKKAVDAVRRRIGRLARAADEAQQEESASGFRVAHPFDAATIATVTGLTEAEVIELRGEVLPDLFGPIAGLSDAALASLELGYGRGNHDEVTPELHARFPRLGGLSAALDLLHQQHAASLGGMPLVEQIKVASPSHVAALDAEYRRVVEAIAATGR